MRPASSLVFIGLLGLFGCGGGGGGSASSAPKPVLSISPATVSFTAKQDGPLPGVQAIQIQVLSNEAAYVGAAWSGVAAPSWMSTPTLTGGGTSWTLQLMVSTTAMPPGAYSAVLHIGVGRSDQTILGYQDAVINYQVQPKLAVAPDSLTFNHLVGTVAPTTQYLSITGKDLAWTALADQSWIKVGTASGNGPATLAIDVDPTGLMPGTVHGQVTISVPGTSETISLPITLNLEAHKLLVNDPGVALAIMPNLAQTTRTLQVRDNGGLSGPWTAHSDQTWLTVTPAGTAGGDLILSANPVGLDLDTIHYATVTVVSGDASVQGPETVKVGFWVGSTEPPPTTQINGTWNEVAVDPIRPFAYLPVGGDVQVYNIYTGAYVRTYSTLAANLQEPVVSADGSTLFAVDPGTLSIVPISLSTGTIGTAWPLGTAVAPHVAYVRTNGVGLVLAGTGDIFEANTGVRQTATFNSGYYGNNVVAASLNGNRFCAMETGLSPSMIWAYEITYSSMEGGRVILSGARFNGAGGNSHDVALDPTGSRAYAASGFPYDFTAFDLNSPLGLQALPSLPAGPYPGNIEVAKDGRIFGTTYAGDPALWIYDTSGNLLRKIPNLSSFDRTLKVSGDGLRVVTLVGGLVLTTVGP